MAIDTPDAVQSGPGIKRITVTGFKSLATKTEVEIRPLTILAGANSSGKSSLMQPLLLMKQTLESDFNAAGPFLLSGPYLQYTETRQFLSRIGKPNGSPQRFTLEFSFGEGLTAGMAYSAEPDAGLVVDKTWGSNAAKKTEWGINRSSAPEALKAMLAELGSVPQFMAELGLTELSVRETGFYLSVAYSVPDSPANGFSMRRRELYYMHENFELNAQVFRMIYVPGLRGAQTRKQLIAEVTEHGFFPGSFEKYAGSVILSWIIPGNIAKIHELLKSLGDLGLASGISPVLLSESELELRVPRASNSDENDFVNIADVGLAVPTILPVLVAIIQADPGQLVYIEQPELHLHPRAQWNLARLLAQAANRGVRLVIETHSSLLLRGILTQIAENKIPNDKVILHWFERDRNTGLTKVHTQEPDPAGRVGDWPEDFGDVELQSNTEYLDAVDNRLLAGKK